MSFLFSQPAPGVLPANSVDFSEVETIGASTLLGNKLGAESTIQELSVSDVSTLLNLGSLQPLDSDLTAIAGLSPANDDLIQRKAGVWTNRTPAQFKTDLSLTKSDVGLSNVANVDQTNASNISSGTLSISYGGTGQTTANAAFNALAPSQATNNGKYLTTDGSNTSWATVTAGVTSVSASSPLASSGGSTPNITISQASAVSNGYLSSADFSTFNSKMSNPMTTAGDIIVGGASGSPGRLALGTVDKVLVSNGTTVSYQYAGLGGGAFPSNTVILGQALPSSMTSTSTVIVGAGSGKASASGNNNTIIGSGSATSITNSASNVIIGQGAATGITTGGGNCVIGASAGASNNFNGVDSVIIGGSASTSATGTIWATVIGYGARVGDGGVSLGRNTNSSGFYSTCLGHGANTGNGGYSVAIGYYSLAAYGFGANGGTNTVGVGSYTGGGSLTTGFSAFTRCLYLGTYAGSYSSGKTDEFMLDNQDRGSYANTQTRSLMYGVFNATASSQTLAINAVTTSTYGYLTALGSVTAPTYSFTGDTNTGLWSSAADTVNLSTGGSERLRVDSSGNVGIGTTSPGQKLEVNGNVKVSNGDLNIATEGKGLAIKSGLNAKIGVTGAFPGGGTNTVTVSTTAVTANSIIFISAVSGATAVDPKIWVSTITANTSFVISSGDNSFTGTVGWMIVEATP